MKNIDLIIKKFGDTVQLIEGQDYPTYSVKKDKFIELVKEFKETYNFNFLVDITAVEYDNYFQAVYHFMNLDEKKIIRIKVDLEKDKPSLPSLTSLFKAADLQEREVFDLMGIAYEGHPNLKRVLCPDDFEGHPLRKNFKHEG